MAKIKKIIQLDELDTYIRRQDYLTVSTEDGLWLLDSLNLDLDSLNLDLEYLSPKGLVDGAVECFSIWSW